MESSGGEPDVIGHDAASGQYIFCDCSAESPAGRRSLCYDGPALHARKENKPEGNAADAAAAMGIELLDEEQYRALQRLGEFDTKTSSWWQHQKTYAHWAAHCFVIAATARFSFTTMGRSPTMPRGASVACCVCKPVRFAQAIPSRSA